MSSYVKHGRKLQGEILKAPRAIFKWKGSFRKLKEPISPALYFYEWQKKLNTCRAFYCDKVLHLTGRGVQYVPLEIISMNFRETRFYK